MENIILNICGWMHLISFQIIAIISTTMAVLSITMMIVMKYKLSICRNDIEEHESTTLQTYNNKSISFKKRINICYLLTCIFILIAGVAMIVFFTFNSTALQYGAYENVQLAQTLDEIHSCKIDGYIESDNIPENLKGKIIIYFKYGCPDCSAIHDSLFEYIKQYGVKDIYFVSSRSDKGKKLIKQYPVDEVPAGVYVRNKKSNISDMYVEILYIKYQTETGKDATEFNKDGFYHLLNCQTRKE